jgi:hypothetical protein
MIVIHAVVFWAVRQQVVSGSSDFRIFYTAGLMLRRGEGRILYSEALQTQIQEEFALPAVQRGGPLPYNHPPFEAILYVPMTYLPYFSAYSLWFGLNILLLAGSIYYVSSWLPTLKTHFHWLLMLVPFAFFPIAYALLQGQDSILLFALYCLAYAALRRGKDLEAGAYLGLGLFKFHLVLPFALILLLRRRWRVLIGMSVIALLEAAVSWAIVGGRGLLYYPSFAWQINRQQAPGVIVPANMANLRGLLAGWKGMNPPPHWIEIAILAVSIGLVIWAARLWRPSDLSDKHRWDSGFSTCLVVSYLVGYHGYNQDMSFLLLPLLLTLDHRLGAWRETSTVLKIIVGTMFFSPLYLFLTLQWSHQNLFSIVLLFLAGYLAASAARAPPQASANRSTAPLSVPLR